jgi:hypothetical protein
MSVAKLLLSGLLVSSGLILGAFTLHARFGPEWEVQASSAARPYGKIQPVGALTEPDRVAAGDVPDNWAPRLTKTDAKSAAAADEAAKAKKRLADKKLAEKRQKDDKAKPEEQTVFTWLSGLLSK